MLNRYDLEFGKNFQNQNIPNQVVIYLYKTILPNDEFYFQFYIRNPLKVVPPMSIQVKALQMYENTISEIQLSAPLLQVKPIGLLTHKLKLGWGLEYSARSAWFYPFPIIVFRSDANSAYNPYNAFSWYFQISYELPEDIQLQIEILTPMKFNSYLMPGSISHNLPNYFGKPV